MLGQDYDDRIVAGLRGLLSSDRANVRNLAINAVSRLAYSRPDIAAEFANAGVADRSLGAMFKSLNLAGRMSQANPALVRRLTCAAFDRLQLRETTRTRDIVREVLRAIVYFAASDQDANERVATLVRGPWAKAHMSEVLAGSLADGLSITIAHDERRRTQALLLDLVRNCAQQVEIMFERHGGDLTVYPFPDRALTTACLGVLMNAAERIYLSSGTMEREMTGGFADTGSIETEQFEILKPILAVLASVRTPKTAYFVIKTLLGTISDHPSEALALAVAAVRSAGNSLASDGLAEGDVRSFVLRYIREHRGLLSSEPSALSKIMDIVDVFIDAGWPQWIDVFTELDRVYRE